MLTDDFRHEIGSAFKVQTTALLARQAAVAASSFSRRSGRLQTSFSSAATTSGTSARMSYPAYIRFLDMKRSRNGKRKKSAPIYNRLVYGYLVAGIYRHLNAIIPDMLVRTVEDTIKSSRDS